MSVVDTIERPQAEPASANEIWYTRCPVPTASGIAQASGWINQEFARHDIAVRSLRASEDKAVRDSHFNHTLPASFREGGNIPAIWARANGQDTVVVGISWVDEEQVILVRPDSEIASVSDLRGRRLAIPKHATKHVDFLRGQDLHGFVTALKLGGLTPDDVNFVDIAADEYDVKEIRTRDAWRHPTVGALLDGRVDAIYAKGATSATYIDRLGLHPILDINAQTDPLLRVNTGTPRPVTVNRDLAERHPEIVARYLGVLLRTGTWAESHPDEVVRVVASETHSSEEAVRRGYGPDLHRHFHVGLSSQYVKGLELQKNFLRDWGFLARDFDFASWIDFAPLVLATKLVAQGEIAFPG
jgi:ABC-type nitrate/sulfonate/bicarbonate transport system substrate-binding protein